MVATPQVTRPIPDRALELHRQMAAEGVGLCYGCKKCSGGCPLTFTTDTPVHQIVRHLQLGQYAPVMESRMIWLCTGCKTCYQRCPNEIDGGHLMDLAKILALSSGVRAADPRVLAFNRSFLNTVDWFGRSYELGMTILYKIRTLTFLADMTLGVRMMARGKLKLLPGAIRSRKEVSEIFKAARRRGR